MLKHAIPVFFVLTLWCGVVRDAVDPVIGAVPFKQ